MQDAKPTSANRILETALDLFATRGYEGTSVREICAAAGITKPTLYYFYGSKEGVYRALVLGTMEELRQEIEQDLARPGEIIARLKRLARLVYADAMRRTKLWRFILTTVWSPEIVDMREHTCAYKQISDLVARALDDAVTRGELGPGPTPIRVMVLLGALGEGLDCFLLLGEPPLTGELADQLIDTVLTGWLPPSSSPSSSSPSLSTPSSSHGL